MFAKVSACLEVLNRTTSVFASQVLSRKLQTLANAIDGAEYFTTSDDPQVTTVTLCGTVFVVDIDVKATGEIVKAKLTYASEDIPTDDGVDRVLADLLRKNDTASFAACIRHLTLLDRHMDLHHLGRALQTDLEAIHALEVAGANGGAGNEYESKREAMSRGHGLPLVNFKRLGTTLVIWERKGRDGAVDVDDKYASDDYAKALITMDECEQTAYYLPKDSTGYLVKAGDMISMATVTGATMTGSPLTFVQPLPDAGCVSAKVALKIELDPPIACTREFAQMIFAKAGVEVQAPLPEPAKRLEEILAPSKPVKAGNKTSSETDAHVLRFEFSCEALDSCVLSSIRFGHPVVLLPVFTYLRRALTFNTILLSALSPPSAPATIRSNRDMIAARLVSWSPPNYLELHVDLFFPFRSLDLTVLFAGDETDGGNSHGNGNGGDSSLSVRCPTNNVGDQVLVDEARLTEVLEATWDLGRVLEEVGRQLKEKGT